MLTDVRQRLSMMAEFGVDMQALCTPPPPLESLFDATTASTLAHVANDGMAQLVRQHAGRFIGVATVSLLDPEAAVRELQRSVRELGLQGVLVYTSVNGRPLDAPEYEPFFAAVEKLNVPIWLHPARSKEQPDYRGEEHSRYGLYLVFGWPYESTLAMARLVFSGLLQRHPGLKVITHHAGAMIPFFARRIEMQYATWAAAASIDVPKEVNPPYLEHFRRFYVDTVTHGSISALMTSYELYGAERMLFASDMPFGPDDGREFVREAVQSLERLPVSGDAKEKIWSSNLLRLCAHPGEAGS